MVYFIFELKIVFKSTMYFGIKSISHIIFASFLLHSNATEERAAFVAKDVTETNSGLKGSITIELDKRSDRITLRSNGIPDHATGTYPEKYDPSTGNPINPNSITEQDFVVNMPNNPIYSDTPYCIPNTPIGFTINGVAIYSPFAAAIENENLDLCDGHPNSDDVYHYHLLPDACLFNVDNGVDPNSIYGIARDGFPIYGPGSGDTAINEADLDECHGKLLGKDADGNDIYRYYMTKTYPYVLGCFRGVPSNIHDSTDTIRWRTETPREGNNCQTAATHTLLEELVQLGAILSSKGP